jgi:CheY-like chemotaxis protein
MKKKILVVDDESSARFLLDLMLRDKFAVETSADSRSALEKAGKEVFDLVLMDINLGNSESGVTTMKRLRELKEYTHIPIIAVTAFAMAKDKKELLNEGFNEYLAKPFEREEIIKLIENTLNNYSPRLTSKNKSYSSDLD